jgi:cytochrome c oxidase subunit II
MKRLFWSLVAAAAVLGPAGYYAATAADAGPQRIALTATKFQFDQKEIHVRKGRAVTFVLNTPDFAHGFAVPDFNVRADFKPGKAIEFTFTPDRAGRFVILCDVFCGEGHDQMSSFLIVTES